MAISSRKNTTNIMDKAKEYFEVGEMFTYSPLVTMRLAPGILGETLVEVVPTTVGKYCERDCDLFPYCGRVDNIENGVFFIPECSSFNRIDHTDVVFKNV